MDKIVPKNELTELDVNNSFDAVKTTKHIKKEYADLAIDEDSTHIDLSQHNFSRIYAIKKTFEGVSFKQTNFKDCYFRNCTFIECDFTGAIIKDSNFGGSTFSECKFEYSHWEKTYLEDSFVDNCNLSQENLAQNLLRNIRINYLQIGNYSAATRAASNEVKTTGIHLKKSVCSNDSYYRDKYKGRSRYSQLFKYLRWKCLDWLWGNGESISKIALSTSFIILVISFLIFFSPSFFLERDPVGISFSKALRLAFSGFFGSAGNDLSPDFQALITFLRFLFFGLFMAVLIRKISRR